jgi:lipooligosaccharide transport system ATP-binding protein
MAPPIITARGLTKRFGAADAVAGIDFDVSPGECFGFLGPNGAGKTSTMRMIYCASPRTAGELAVLGRDPEREPRAIKQELGVVMQDDLLDEALNVEENLLLFAVYHGVGRRAARDRAREALAHFGLADRARSRPRELSGGMRRRVAIARALLAEPKILILDEPTTGLDPQFRHELWQHFLDLRERGITVLLTTHYMEEAERLCDRLVIMDRGRIVATGTPAGLIAETVPPSAVEVRATAAAERARIAGDLGPQFGAPEEYSDRLVFYTSDGDRILGALRAGGYAIRSELVRRTTLEDVFLKKTGRELAP